MLTHLLCTLTLFVIIYNINFVNIIHFQYMQKADDGVIEKIVLINFMCHKHYEVELDSNINFIIGRNGSTLV